MSNEKENNYKGYSLFNDIEDEDLRTRNRAVVLTNLSEDNSKNGKIKPQAAGTILGYFNQIPEHERGPVAAEYVKQMQLRGFKYGAK